MTSTPAQDALLQLGNGDVVQSVLGEMQMGMADEMQAAVERITARTVSAYVPGFNSAANATTDVFSSSSPRTSTERSAVAQPREGAYSRALWRPWSTGLFGPPVVRVSTVVGMRDPAPLVHADAQAAAVRLALERLAAGLDVVARALDELGQFVDAARTDGPPSGPD